MVNDPKAPVKNMFANSVLIMFGTLPIPDSLFAIREGKIILCFFFPQKLDIMNHHCTHIQLVGIFCDRSVRVRRKERANVNVDFEGSEQQSVPRRILCIVACLQG